MKRAAVFLCVAALAGCAAPRQPQRDIPKEWHPAVNMLLKYDANHDGSITRAEMEAGLKADFAKADYKHKGCLDEDETEAVNEERFREDKSAATPLVDFSQNGCISFDEFADAPRSLFDQLDTDNNGILTPKEIHPEQQRQDQQHPLTDRQNPYL